VLLELEVEIGVGEPALRPVLVDDDIVRLGNEVRVPVTAPGPVLEDPVLVAAGLVRGEEVPVRVVALAPATVRDDEDLDARRTRRGGHRAQVVEQADLGGDLFDQGPQLPPFGEEVVVGVHQEQPRVRRLVLRIGHESSLQRCRGVRVLCHGRSLDP
jgi:hypothetical protein